MQRRLDRAESMRLAKEYIAAHERKSLSAALSDSTCPTTATLATLLHACGFYFVSVEDKGQALEFYAGPTESMAASQISYVKGSSELSGAAESLLNTVYLLMNAIEHELGAAVYLPLDMRQERVRSVCNRLGVDEEFFDLVLRSQTI